MKPNPRRKTETFGAAPVAAEEVKEALAVVEAEAGKAIRVTSAVVGAVQVVSAAEKAAEKVAEKAAVLVAPAAAAVAGTDSSDK
jgi:hypothetical protein